MGRKLTEAELAEFNERRKNNGEKIAAALGITLEELEKQEDEARQREPQLHEKEQAQEILKKALLLVDEIFALKQSPEEIEAQLANLKNADDLNETEIIDLLAEGLFILDTDERKMAVDSFERTISKWQDSEYNTLPLMTGVLLNLGSMVKAHNYYATKE